MQRVIERSYLRVIEQDDLPGYNKQWKPKRQTGQRLASKHRLVILFLIGICVAALFLGGFQQASAKSQSIDAGGFAPMQGERVSAANVNIEPGGVQGDYYTSELAQSGIWSGLAASLSGALVMGLSFLVLQRQKAE